MTYRLIDLIKHLEECPTDIDWTGKNGLMPVAAKVLKAILVCRQQYGEDGKGNALYCHNEIVEEAIEAFLKFDGAIFYNGKPLEKFGVGTGAMAAAIQAYLDSIAKDIIPQPTMEKNHDK